MLQYSLIYNLNRNDIYYIKKFYYILIKNCPKMIKLGKKKNEIKYYKVSIKGVCVILDNVVKHIELVFGGIIGFVGSLIL